MFYRITIHIKIRLQPFSRHSLIYCQFGDKNKFYRPVGTKLKFAKNVLRKAHSKVVSLSSLLFYTCSPRRWLSSIGGFAEYLICSMKRTTFLSTVCFRKNSVFFYCFCTKSYKIVGISSRMGILTSTCLLPVHVSLSVFHEL